MKLYELIIIGAGPAGLTAGIYAARKKMDFIIITEDIGGMTKYSWDIENYLGYQFITGPELVEKFREHINEFNVEIREGQKVIEVLKDEENFKISTKTDTYFTKTIIIATGRRPKELNVKGEKEFRNKGITYCATCDAPLFRDKIVGVIGGGNSGLDAVLQLSRIAKKIYLIEIKDHLTGDFFVINKIKKIDKVEIFTNTKVVEIYGDKFVQGIKIIKNNEIIELKVDGLFVEIGSIPNSEIIDFVEKNQYNEIIVDCKNRTSHKGVFAAGDVTNVFAKQIIVACGEGAKAAISSFEYLKYL
ncbi:MAG: FAD-dependent oxidoreductase [Candidatus Omnitrophica bacterium]|nr:FAD-dependent oxidoreductase [Candidatus Omnitrophota bacterium]MCM8809881.1 FAD-dependent oxidoreductase [Candidatus Omnitrophota bacterium]MCM8810592.1 FAD-dependent oxidoreductase [Candidatus Omnitrophota bacterium]MCM8832733.1 FAD-dependent oxidoreductase [Candidatus Omnitrophota bacterium]